MPSSTNNEKIKKLIHSASILVKQLDTAVAKAKTCRDLFTPEVIELHSQLAYLCFKSMRADPLQCRRRAEELLWKKCYYDVITSAKTNAKKTPLNPTEKFLISNHIDSGIVKFNELLQDLCLRLENVEPPIKFQLNVLPSMGAKIHDNQLPKESKEELMESVQKVLVWLGDLSRYRIDLEISNDIITAERFYHQAIVVNPTIGLPYNQLGTLTSHDPCKGFESIFYYVRSMKASKVFPGAEPNLKALLTRLAANEDKLLSSFSQLFLKLVFVDKAESALEISQLCQVTLGEIQTQTLRNCDNGNRILLDVAASVIMCTIVPSSSTNNNEGTAAIAFCCSLFSHLLTKFQELFNLKSEDVAHHNRSQQTNENKESVQKPNEEGDDDSTDEEEQETKRAKLRRRKVGSGSSDQEFSEEEIFLETDSESESEDEVLSDSGFHSADAKIEPLLDIPSEAASLLPVFKLLTDWFQLNSQVVQISNPTIRKMWITLADILNAFKRCQREEVNHFCRVPLEEDWKLYGVSAVSSLHAQFDFDNVSPPANILILNSVRIQRIILFGDWLAQQDKAGGFKIENGLYKCPTKDDNNEKSEEVDKTDLMRNMAHLWLKSEVQELERQLSPQTKRKKKTNFDLAGSFVYLVPDVSALSDYTHLIKQIIKSQKLIVVIPEIVISEMDQLKRESSLVRECIRWLESCFRAGNRFVRAQRQNEHQIIPLLTYPKRKDKANWTLFQILECCYYLDSNQQNVYKAGQNSPTVLFLTGSISEETNAHTKGICSSIGLEFKTANMLMKKTNTKKR